MLNIATQTQAQRSELVRLDVAAQAVGVSVDTVRRYANSGAIRAYRPRTGRIVRVDLSEVLRYFGVDTEYRDLARHPRVR